MSGDVLEKGVTGGVVPAGGTNGNDKNDYMNRLHSLKILAGLAAVTLLAACSQDDGLTQDDTLPPGKYPIELNVAGLEVVATPDTRSTVDGEWDTGARIAVQAVDDPQKPACLYTTDGKPADEDVMLYWSSKTEHLRAWHTGESTSTELPESWSVPTLQDEPGGYEQGDFLFSEVTEATYPNKANLTFYHQMTKVIVHIRNTEITATTKPEDVTLSLQNIAATGTFTAPSETGGKYGTWNTEGKQTAEIIPLPLGQQTFTYDKQQETSVASFTALIIPQTIAAGTKLLVFTMEQSDFSYVVPTGDIEWKGGEEYTFVITLTADKLVDVEVDVNSLDGLSGFEWTDGGSTSGSYDIPQSTDR